MQSELLTGVNSKYIYFPENESTVLSASRFSILYLGADAVRGNKVVIKKLNPRLGYDERAKLRFLIEASVQVNHPGVIKTLDLVKYDDTYFIIQEFVIGADLKELIKLNSFKNETILICRLMINILDALEAVHKHNIVHRDIKPSNILIEFKDTKKDEIDWNDPKIKIIDFGLSKTNDRIPLFRESKKRHPYSILYSSPEVVLNREDLTDQRSDIYSAGLVMMELFTGEPVFYFDNPAKILSKQISDQPRRPSKMFPKFYDIFIKSTSKEKFKVSPSKMPPDVVKEILLNGLNQRYETAEEMKKDILKFLDDPGELPQKGLKSILKRK